MIVTTEEHSSLRETVRRYARKELASGYLARAKSERFLWEELQELGELGLLELLVDPSEHPDFVALGIVVEELCYADFNVGNLLIVSALNSFLLATHASDAVRDRWLPSLRRGEALVALGLTEPGSGSDAAAMRTRAVPDKDGGWLIDGEKTSMTAAPFAQAALVFARTGAGPTAPAGVTAFVVPLDAEGISRSRFPDTGFRPLGRGSVIFDGVRVDDDARVGPVGRAFATIMNGFDFSRPLLALGCLATAQAALDETVEYARIRHAFGSPIARYEGVSFPLAEHLTYIEAARLLCYETLGMRQRGERHTRQAAMTKWWAPKLAFDAIHDCLLLHGHVAYSEEHPMEQRLRDVMGIELGDGTAQIQKIVIAREAFGREFVPYGTTKPRADAS